MRVLGNLEKIWPGMEVWEANYAKYTMQSFTVEKVENGLLFLKGGRVECYPCDFFTSRQECENALIAEKELEELSQ